MAWASGNSLTPSTLNRVVPSWLSSALSASGLSLINVNDYGADRTGVADSTAALRSAYAAANGGATVLFPPGVYLVQSTVTIPDNVLTLGYGATVKNSSTTIGNMLTNANQVNGVGVSFAGLTIDGNGSIWPAGDPDGIKDSWNGISLVSAGRFFVRDVKLTGVYAYDTDVEAALRISNSSHFRLGAIEATNNKQDSIYINNCADYEVDGVECWDNGGSGLATDGPARAFARISNVNAVRSAWTAMTSQTFTGITINAPDTQLVNCRGRLCTGAGINIGHTGGAGAYVAHRAQLVNCAGNDNVLHGIAFQASDDLTMIGCSASSNSDTGFKHSVSGNRITLIGCVASGNTLRGIDISASSSTGHRIINCESYLNLSHGIALEQTYQSEVVGCTARDNDNGVAGRAGILISLSNDAWVHDNQCFDSRAGGARTQSYGIQLSSVGSVTLSGNLLRNNIVTDVYETGTNSKATTVQRYDGWLSADFISSSTTNQSLATAKIPNQGQLAFSILSLTSNGAEFGVRSGNTVYRWFSDAVG